MDQINSEKYRLNARRKNRKISHCRFFVDSWYFLVCLNVVSVLVSVFSNIAISMSVSVNRPTFTLG